MWYVMVKRSGPMGASLYFPDFDALVALHRIDPVSFEDVRRSILRAAVDEAPVAHRPALEQLLQRIERARAEAPSPVEAAEGAFRMMCASADRLCDAWEDVRFAVAEWQTAVVIDRVRH
jgi:hypothetical protein